MQWWLSLVALLPVGGVFSYAIPQSPATGGVCNLREDDPASWVASGADQFLLTELGRGESTSICPWNILYPAYCCTADWLEEMDRRLNPASLNPLKCQLLGGTTCVQPRPCQQYTNPAGKRPLPLCDEASSLTINKSFLSFLLQLRHITHSLV